MSIARSSLVALVLGASVASVGSVACGSPNGAVVTSDDNDVTSIPVSSVQDQGQSGNCWLYATAGWMESLHAARTGDTSLHLAPSYWLYWDLYDQIVNGEIAATGGQVIFGGYWARAVDLAARYGMMKMGDFEADDAVASVNALNAVNAAIASGALGPDAQKDRTTVLATLNHALGLSDALATALANTFGKDGTRTFDVGAQAADPTILSPHDFAIRTVRAGTDPVASTLDQVLGVRGAPIDPTVPRYFTRVGPLAWQTVVPGVGQSAGVAPGQFRKMPRRGAPLGDGVDGGSVDGGSFGMDGGAGSSAGTVDMERFFGRMQRALNDGAPLPFGWFVSFGAVDMAGRFHATPAAVYASQTGGHETLVTDYEVTGVPGSGTIPVGFQASEAQKQAALAGHITFFRTKNSWGSSPVGWLEPLAGYNDLDTDYLTSALTVCPDPAANAGDDAASPVGSPTLGACSALAPLVLDVGLPPGY